MISKFLPFIYIKQNCVTLTLTAPTGWGEWTNKATQVQPIAHTHKHSYQLLKSWNGRVKQECPIYEVNREE
jgi:hypothetical protein